MAFCVKCGKQLPDTAKFCTSCGAPVNRKTVPVEESRTPAEEVTTVPAGEPEVSAPVHQPVEEPAPAAPKAERPAAVQTAERPRPAEPVKAAPKEQGKKSPVVPIVIALIAVIVVGVGGFFGFQSYQVNKEYKEQMEQAEGYVEDGEYRKAAARYKAALELKPGDEAATFGQAKMYLLQEDYSKAEKAYQDIVDQDPTDLEGLLGLADAFFGQGKYNDAEENYQAVLKDVPENSGARLGMAKIYSSRGDTEKAVENYRAVLNVEPKQMDAVLGLADLYLKTGDYVNAGETLKAVQPGPGDEGYSRYQYLQSMAEFRPEIKELDTSNFPQVAVTVVVNGGQYISYDQVEIMENDTGCYIDDWNELTNGVQLYYTAEKASQSNDERVVKVQVRVDDLSFEMEERYTAIYGPDVMEQFAGVYRSVTYPEDRMNVAWSSPWADLDYWGPEWGNDMIRFNANYMSGREFRVYENSYGTYERGDILYYFDGTIRFVPAEESAYGADTVIIEGGDYQYNEIYVREGDFDPAAVGAGDYLLPTDREYITAADLAGMTKEQVVLARNEIYARYGYDFQADNIREYFASKTWYHADPSVNASTFGTQQMNEYEKANLEVIQNYEKAMGWK